MNLESLIGDKFPFTLKTPDVTPGPWLISSTMT